MKDLKERLNQSKTIKIKIKSDSMEPLLKVHSDYDLFKIENLADLKRFDIIVFWQVDRYICHFVWKKQICLNTSDEIWITRSLKNKFEDDLPIKKEQILGIIRDYRVSMIDKLICLIGNLIRNSS